MRTKINLRNEGLADGRSLKHNISDINDNVIDWILCKTKIELIKHNQMDVSEMYIDPEKLIPARFLRHDKDFVALMQKSYAMILSVRDLISSLHSDMLSWR